MKVRKSFGKLFVTFVLCTKCGQRTVQVPKGRQEAGKVHVITVSSRNRVRVLMLDSEVFSK